MNDSSLEIKSEIPFVRVSLKSVLKVKMKDSEAFCCFAVNSAGNDSSFFTFSVGKVTGKINLNIHLIKKIVFLSYFN